MGTIRYPNLSLYFRSFGQLFGELTGYLTLVGNSAVAVHRTAAMVVEFPPDGVLVPFVGNALPASLVRALDQLPRLISFSVEDQSDGQWVYAHCEGDIRDIKAEFRIPLSGRKVITLADRLINLTGQSAVQELGTRKLAEFADGWQFGEYSFLKSVLKPVQTALKTVHPTAPRATFVTADIVSAADLVSPKPVPVLRLQFTGFGKVTALVIPASAG